MIVCWQDYEEGAGAAAGAGPAFGDGAPGVGGQLGAWDEGEGAGGGFEEHGGPPRMAFECKMDNVKTLAVVLSALSMPKKEQHAFFTATAEGGCRGQWGVLLFFVWFWF